MPPLWELGIGNWVLGIRNPEAGNPKSCFLFTQTLRHFFSLRHLFALPLRGNVLSAP